MIENKGVWSPSKDEFLHLMSYDAEKGEYRQFYFDKDNLVCTFRKLHSLRHQLA
jgi:hypothetical protein